MKRKDEILDKYYWEYNFTKQCFDIIPTIVSKNLEINESENVEIFHQHDINYFNELLLNIFNNKDELNQDFLIRDYFEDNIYCFSIENFFFNELNNIVFWGLVNIKSLNDTNSKLLDVLLNESNATYFLVSEDGTYLPLFNRKQNDLDIIPYQESVGRNIKDKLPRQLVNDSFKIFEKVKKTKVPKKLKYEILVNNNLKKVEATVTNVNKSDFLIVSRDITQEEKRKEVLINQQEVQDLLFEVSKSFLVNENNLESTINDTLKIVGEKVGSDRVYIFEHDYINGLTSNTFEWCAIGISKEIENLQNFPIESIDKDWMDTHKKGEPYTILDLPNMEESPLKEALISQGIKSLIAAPIIGNKNELLGFVGFDWVKTYFKPQSYQIFFLEVYATLLYNTLKNKENLNIIILKNKLTETLIEEFNSPLIAFNEKGEIDICNKSFSNLVGYSKEEILSFKTPFPWWPSAEIEKFYTEFNKFINIDVDNYIKELNFINKNGKTIPVKIVGKKIEVGSFSIRYAQLYDLTSQKALQNSLNETSNLLHLSQEAGNICNFYINIKTKNVKVSNHFMKIFERNPSNNLIDYEELLEAIVPNNKIIEFKDKILKYFEKKSNLNFKCDTLVNGKSKIIKIEATVNYTNFGEPTEIFGIIKDITKEENYVRKVELQNLRLKEVAWLNSHELRGPLVSILSLLESIDENEKKNFSSLNIEHLEKSLYKIDDSIKKIANKLEIYDLNSFEGYNYKNTINSVIVVDDDNIITTLSKKLLNKIINIDNLSIQSFENGFDFTNFLSSVNSNENLHQNKILVFLDLNMPKMNGWDVLEFIKKHALENFVTISILSSSINLEDKRRALKYDFVIEFLEKPLSKEKLESLLERFKFIN
jgi:PAS domain S-box-containing protein